PAAARGGAAPPRSHGRPGRRHRQLRRLRRCRVLRPALPPQGRPHARAVPPALPRHAPGARAAGRRRRGPWRLKPPGTASDYPFPMNRRNYYRVLHVQPDAPTEIIRMSYLTLMRRLKMHPDLGGDHRKAALINEAFATLVDPVR